MEWKKTAPAGLSFHRLSSKRLGKSREKPTTPAIAVATKRNAAMMETALGLGMVFDSIEYPPFVARERRAGGVFKGLWMDS